RARLLEGCGIDRVEVAGDGEAIRRWNLNDEEEYGARAARRHGSELPEMLGAAVGHAVREFGEPRLAHEMDVLDLQIAGRPRRIFEQKIDPGVLSVFDLPPHRRVVAQLRNEPGLERVADELIR